MIFTPCQLCANPLVCSDLGDCYIKQRSNTHQMTPTPRTDSIPPFYCESDEAGINELVDKDFARQLERELNAAKSVIESLKDALIDISEYWDLDERETSMSDACWHAVGTADKALEKLKEHNK